MATGEAVGTLGSLARYPVKSMQGEVLDAGHISPSGLDRDRGWALLHAETGHALTAKRHGHLLEAQARLTEDGPEILLPDATVVRSADSQADAALSEWLGMPVTLSAVRAEATPFTMSFNLHDEDVDTFQWSTPAGSYVDLAPIHLLTSAALEAATEQHPSGNWSVHRFRPTVYIETDERLRGFIENDWVGASLAIGEVVVDITMPTIRCTLPTKAQPLHGLARDVGIFTSLAEANTQNLGAYATVRTPGTVHLGDTVRLLAG